MKKSTTCNKCSLWVEMEVEFRENREGDMLSPERIMTCPNCKVIEGQKLTRAEYIRYKHENS